MNPQNQELFERYEDATKLKAPPNLTTNVLTAIHSQQTKPSLLIPLTALTLSLIVCTSILIHTKITPSPAPPMPMFSQNPETQLFNPPHSK